MKKNDLIIITKNAVRSFAIASIVACAAWAFSPVSANAVGDKKTNPKDKSTAVSKDGAVVTGKISKDAVVLNVSNPTNQPVQVQVQTQLTNRRLIAPMSRVAPIASLELNKLNIVELKPGELRRIRLAARAKMKAGEEAKLEVKVDGKKTTLSTAAALPVKAKASPSK